MIHVHTHQDSYDQKTIPNVGTDVEKLELSYTTGGNAKRCRPFGKQFGSSSKY